MRKENVQRSSRAVAAMVLAVVLLFMLNWIAVRHWKRVDWTQSHLYTLSEKSLNIIGELDSDVKITVFMTPLSPLFSQVRELLNRYDAASDRISVEFIDPDRSPIRTKELAEKFGIAAANTVVFSSGERSKYVTSDQLADYDYSGMQMGGSPRLKSFTGEERFTSAILSLVAPDVPKIYFVTGHGEAAVHSSGEQQRSLSLLIEALKRENMETADCTLISGHVPEDASVLAIVGPVSALTPMEISAIQKFLENGGRLFFALDPLLETGGTIRKTGMEDLMTTWGVRFGSDLVIDTSRTATGYDLSAIFLNSLGPHAITKGMDGYSILFLVARSVSETGDGSMDVAPLVETTSTGWGETDLAGLLEGKPAEKTSEDLAGPVAVGVAVEAREEHEEPETTGNEEEKNPEIPPTRLVVFGDSDFLEDGQLLIAGNQVLAVNAFNWLADREQSLGIPPKAIGGDSLFLTSHQITLIFIFVIFLMPVGAIIAGIIVWWRRKH